MKRLVTKKSILKDDIEELKFKLISNSRFKQQRLPAWRPVPTICVIISVYSFFGLIFIAIGVVVLLFSNKIVTIERRYDNDIDCENKTSCTINISIIEDMKPPIMVYYKLEGFYQNHRRYLKSQSYIQLYEGKDININNTDDFQECDPIIKNKDLNIELGNLDNESLAIPCGLIAKTYFNDTFTNWRIISGDNNNSLTLYEDNIAWDKDRDLIRNTTEEKNQWINMEEQHFLVWMRPSGLPDTQKLYGRIKDRLKKDDIILLEIKNIYDVSYYNGSKKIILSTVNKLGGKNDFLGIAYIVVGGISILFGIIFPIIYFSKNKGIKMKDN